MAKKKSTKKKTTRKKSTRKKTTRKKVAQKKTIQKKQKTTKKVTKKVKPKIIEDKMQGLKIYCPCGRVITSLYTYYINHLDIGRWECPACSESHLIQIDIEELGQAEIPKEKKESRKKCVRMKCLNEECEALIYAPTTNYVNRLPKQSNWRCQECGAIYRIKMKYDVGLNPETDLRFHG